MRNVAGAVIIKNNSVFLARRKMGEKLYGFWEFPGGKLEVGETAQECLERELFEELNIRSKAGEIIAESVFHYEHGSFNLLGVFAEILDEENLSLSVHDRVEWVNKDDLLTYKLAPADIPIAKKVLEFI